MVGIKTKHKRLSTKIEKETFLRLEILKKELGFSNFTEVIRYSVKKTIKAEGLPDK